LRRVASMYLPPSVSGLRGEPCVARIAGGGEETMEPLAVGIRHEALETLDLAAVARELLQQQRAARDRDVAPHFRRARGEPREIANAPRREAEVLRCVGTQRELLHERE